MLRRSALVAFAGVAAIPVAIAPVQPTAAAPPASTDDVVAVVLDGQGSGHGRGLSQWGAYGRAISRDPEVSDWTKILYAYYGGSHLTQDIPPSTRLQVRLTSLGAGQAAIVSDEASAQLGGAGAGYASIVVRPNGVGSYDVWGSASRACPGASDDLASAGFIPLALSTSSATITSPTQDQSGGTQLGVCQPSGSVRYYRGQLVTSGGQTRNDVLIEHYVRGVVPSEMPASWGSAADGMGINALRAQAVAARTYALRASQPICDTSSCQVYNGAGSRASLNEPYVPLGGEFAANVEQAVAVTAGVVLRTPTNELLFAEYSSSHGGASALGLDDPYDNLPANPNYRWTRVLSPAQVLSAAGASGTLTDAYAAAVNTSSSGLWANAPRLTVDGSTVTANANSFRSALGLPSVAFTIRVIRRDFLSGDRLAFIGDSVGESVTAGSPGKLPMLLDGVFATPVFDARTNRCTVGPTCAGGDGVGVVSALASDLDLAVVELGYNDSPSTLGTEIDQMMTALVAKGVRTVAWVNMSQRRPQYATSNQALAAARSRWPQLVVLDWDAASAGPDHDRWYADNVHLTSTGQAEFALWLRNQALALTDYVPGSWSIKVNPATPLRLKVAGVNGVPAGVSAVSLNVTAVTADSLGFLTVWPCSAARPVASNVNYGPGQTVANAVIAPVDANGEVCFYSQASAHLLVDINGWFTSGFSSIVPNRLLDTRTGVGAPKAKIQPAEPLRLQVAGVGAVPAGTGAVSLNVTVTEPSGDGYLTVFPCASGIGPGSSVNFRRNDAVPNAVIAPVDANGEICLYSSVPTNAIVDINGWFTSGFAPMAPDRLLDTRNGIGAPKAKVQPAGPLRLQVAGVGPVPAGTTAVSLNVTVTEPAAQGYITVWPCASPMPVASNVNYTAGQPAVANAVIAPLDGNGELCIYTYAAANVIVDINGWFTGGLATQVPNRLVDTRNGIGPIPGR